MQDQVTALKNHLSALIDRDDYKLIRASLGKLRALVNAQPESSSEEKSYLVNEVKIILRLLLEMHSLIKDGHLEPHGVYRDILSQASGVDTVQYSGNVFSFSRAHLLTQAFQEIKTELDTIIVPVVMLVMTRAEALQLTSKQIFTNYQNSETYFDEFNKLQATLEQEEITGLLDRYGDRPEQWQPFTDSQETIGSLIQQALDKVTGFKKPLRPEFIEVVPMTAEATEQSKRSDLRLLREEGCLVVMDVVSLRHPAIQQAYRRSLLDVFRHILVITLAPSSKAFAEHISQEMISFADRFSSMEFWKRLNWDSDAEYCDEVYEHRSFLHSLQIRAPKMIDGRQKKLNSKNIQNDFKDQDGTA
jgi:hypothetical protein